MTACARPFRCAPTRRPAPAHRLGLAVLLPAALASCAPPAADEARVSEFGRYEGYSEPIYDSWVNTSQYVEMRDGVRLAVDVTFPAIEGEAAPGPFPMVWTHSRYHRNPGQLARFFAPEGAEIPEINSMVDASPDLQLLARHGYVVAAVQVRGGGASFGAYQGLFSEAETDDAREMIEWFSTQPWSDGNVGMYGGSYLGMTQYMAASEMHPALKAIFPNVAGLDMYDQLHPGGVYRKDMIDHWGELTRNLDLEWPAPTVDGDDDGSLRAAAMAEHEDNWDVQVEYEAGRFRDHDIPTLTWTAHGVSGVLDEVKAAAVPAYHWNGWYDIFVLDAALLWANYEGPQKMGIGAWSHAGMPDSLLMAESAELTAVEQLRWFDYWLKGIDNGIMDEPPIHHAVMNGPGDWDWASADAWPVAGAEDATWYMAEGPSGSVASVNDGLLSMDGPEAGGSGDGGGGGDEGIDRYDVDLTTTTGTTTRWDNAVAGAPLMIYPDMTPNDAKSLTYTTAPLEADVNVTGHPVVTLWLSSSTGDADVIVLLQEVDANGMSHYVSEGVLRASHRTLAEAPWYNLGLPFQRSFAEDAEPLPEDGPGELVMDLLPTSTVFNAGHRIRVTIMGADADNIELPAETPTIAVHRTSAHASRIVLPVVR